METETINLDFTRLSWEQQERLRKAKIGESVDCGDVWVVKERSNGGCPKCCFMIDEECTLDNSYYINTCGKDIGILGNFITTPKTPEIPNQIPQHVIDAANAALAFGDSQYGDTTAESIDKAIEAANGNHLLAATKELFKMMGHGFKIAMGEFIDADSGQPHINFVLARATRAAMILKRMGE
jgi:hypothetical protein